MTYKLLLTASTIALISIGPQFAAADTSDENSVSHTIEKGWDETKETMSDVADGISEASKEAYEGVRARIIDPNKDPKVTLVQIDTKMTAAGMIGEPVYNVDGDRVAKVHDIILDQNGGANMIVLADGDFTGMGKLAAFKYSAITIRENDGDLLTTLTEDMIDEAIPFTYEKSMDDEVSQTVGAQGLSLNKLLEADIVDNAGETLADIENLTLRGGKIDQVIAEFDDTFGIGGERVAISFAELNIRQHDETYDFVMSQEQANQFEAYKDVVTN